MLSIHGDKVNIIKEGITDPHTPQIKRHAEVEINGQLRVGDIVSTDTIRDYYKTRMHLSTVFNRCILHIAARDEFSNLRVKLKNGKPLTTIIKTK